MKNSRNRKLENSKSRNFDSSEIIESKIRFQKFKDWKFQKFKNLTTVSRDTSCSTTKSANRLDRKASKSTREGTAQCRDRAKKSIVLG